MDSVVIVIPTEFGVEPLEQRERCSAVARLIGVKPPDESAFSANTAPEALTSQLDILQARGEWPSE